MKNGVIVILLFSFVIISQTAIAEDSYEVSSYNQSGGITAGVVNMQKPARHFNTQSKTQLLTFLPKEKVPVIINSLMNDSEAYTFAEEISDYLKSEGWAVEHLQAMWSRPLVGQRVSPVKDGKLTIDIGSRS